MRAIINSQKHIVQETLAVIEEQTIRNIVISVSVPNEPALTNQVVVGSVVKAIWFEYWLLGESSQPCTATWNIEKVAKSDDPMTQAEGQAMNSYGNKSNVLRIGQGVIGDSNSNPIPVIREWIKVPKGMQRMALGDRWFFNCSCIGEADNGLEICGFALYKEYQ